MTQPRAKQLLQAAREGGYALGAFNAVNLETAQAIVQAAELEARPVILQVSENAARYAGLEVLSALVQALRADVSVPIILHYDHAESLASAKRALELGFDAVMLETGHLAPEEALAQLTELAGLAHARGALVEAEVGITPKDGRKQERALSPEAIAAFAEESTCDLLAVDIGSKHKRVTKELSLDLERLETIASLTALPLVLHGASGVSSTSLSRAVRLGVSKVNIATELMLSFTQGVRDALQDPTLYDPRVYLAHARNEMLNQVRHLIRNLSQVN